MPPRQAFFRGWPDWLENDRINDERKARAYEDISPAYRAALKTGIALSHFYFGDQDAGKACARTCPRLGMHQHSVENPADWAIFIIAGGASPSRICGAIMPAILAGVKQLAAVFLHGQPPPPALLALELCGLEDVFTLAAAEIEKLLAQTSGDGRLVILAPSGWTEAEAAADMAAAHDIKYILASQAPRLLLMEPKRFDLEKLVFLHGVKPEQDSEFFPCWDCVFTSQPCPKDLKTRLSVGTGCEGFWLEENVTPDFFRSRCLRVELLPREE